jgi:hypothetical protein
VQAAEETIADPPLPPVAVKLTGTPRNTQVIFAEETVHTRNLVLEISTAVSAFLTTTIAATPSTSPPTTAITTAPPTKTATTQMLSTDKVATLRHQSQLHVRTTDQLDGFLLQPPLPHCQWIWTWR